MNNFNEEPTHRRLRFSFEVFDQMLAEALDEPEETVVTPLFKEWFGDDFDDAA